MSSLHIGVIERYKSTICDHERRQQERANCSFCTPEAEVPEFSRPRALRAKVIPASLGCVAHAG